jgi:hypothetical protein
MPEETIKILFKKGRDEIWFTKKPLATMWGMDWKG